jgi:hypothetical protein
MDRAKDSTMELRDGAAGRLDSLCTEVPVLNVADLSTEVADCQFGDARLTKRARKLADALSRRPNISIPAALKTKADIEACYRFFNNEKVTPAKILQPHIERTYERIRQTDFALLVQDTTELDLTRPEQQVEGAGPMDSESRRGLFYHPMLALDMAGVPLGIVGEKSWTREEISTDSKAEKNKQRKQTPIEEKESYRWIEGIRIAERAAAACEETTCVCVGDSESDIYDVFAAASQSKQANLQLLVRAGQNRNTTGEEDWADQVRKTAKIGEQTLTIRARKAKIGKGKSARSRSREGRIAELEIRKATIEICRPAHSDRRLPATITVNVVLCEETNPPEGEDAISWMLVTTLPIETDEEVQRIILAYCVRWQIEVYFRTLKSGCRIERRRFEHIDRVLNCLAFYSVVAWRVMYVCYLGRECPEMDCEVIFEPSEWKSVYTILDLEFPAAGCPSLNELVRAIACLGGFIDRPKNNPGTQTLWIGLQRCYDLSTAWNTFGPGSKKILPG